MSQKNPWVAAILNLFLPGAGYVYSGHRVRFGVLLLAAMALVLLGPAPEAQEQVALETQELAADPAYIVILVAAGVISLAFAYDAYNDAQERSRHIQND